MSECQHERTHSAYGMTTCLGCKATRYRGSRWTKGEAVGGDRNMSDEAKHADSDYLRSMSQSRIASGGEYDEVEAKGDEGD